jgi:hypothetical protein
MTRNCPGTPAALMLALALGACASPDSAPRLDGQFGRAVQEVSAAQVLHPDAGKRPAQALVFDGPSGVNALTRHRDSFKAPPPTFTILGIGGSPGGGGGGGGQ